MHHLFFFIEGDGLKTEFKLKRIIIEKRQERNRYSIYVFGKFLSILLGTRNWGKYLKKTRD